MQNNLNSVMVFFWTVVTEFKTAKVFPCISQHAQDPVGRKDREQMEELFQGHTEKTLFADSPL